MKFNSGRNTRKRAGFHKNFRGSRKQEKDKFHLISLCIVVCSICAAAVGLASVLGSFEFTINLCYVPKKKQEKSEEKQKKGYFRIIGQ